MATLELDPLTNDLVFENGSLSTISGDEEIRQKVEFVLRTQLGEWSFDTAFGVPYLEEILIKDFDLDQIKARLTAILAAVEGVTEVTELTLTLDEGDRILRVNGRVDTRGGRAEFATEIGV